MSPATQTYGLPLLATIALLMVFSEIQKAVASATYRGPTMAAAQQFNQPYVQTNPYGAAQQPSTRNTPRINYGLVQSGIVGVARMNSAGTFGQPTPMPIFQMVELHATQQVTATRLAVQQKSTQGRTSQTTAITCNIRGISVVTESQASCKIAGGQVAKTSP